MTIGIFGGTFDPPHRGHMRLAALAREQLGLDRVEVIPSFTPPHRTGVLADPYERFAMVVLACRDEPALIPSPRELRRGGVSYTVETLREVRRDHPAARLVLIVGADSYDDLPNWKEAAEIRSLAELAVVDREGARGPGTPREAHGVTRIDDGHGIVWQVEAPLIPVSARDLRRRLRRGETDLPELDPVVERYIRAVGLYREEERVKRGRTA